MHEVSQPQCCIFYDLTPPENVCVQFDLQSSCNVLKSLKSDFMVFSVWKYEEKNSLITLTYFLSENIKAKKH